MPATAMITPAIGHIVRAMPAESWTGTTSTAVLMPTLAAASGSNGEKAKKAALPEPVTIVATTMMPSMMKSITQTPALSMAAAA